MRNGPQIPLSARLQCGSRLYVCCSEKAMSVARKLSNSSIQAVLLQLKSFLATVQGRIKVSLWNLEIFC